jgi:hypothetical protein
MPDAARQAQDCQENFMTIPSQTSQPEQCRRLQQQVERDGGTHNLSQTDLAFYQTFCEVGESARAPGQASALEHDSGIDESAHIYEDTLFGDPNAGLPDDPDDANPSHAGRAVLQPDADKPRPSK